MDKTVAPSFDSDNRSLHSVETMDTNVAQSFDKDSDKHNAHSREIMISYEPHVQSNSLEVGGHTNGACITDASSEINRTKQVETLAKQDEKTISFDEESNSVEMTIAEFGLWESNQNLKKVFRFLGIYLLKWDNKEDYIVQRNMFNVSYICWFVWPMIGLLLAYFGSRYLGIEDITGGIQGAGQSITSLTIYILMLALTPAIQTYVICVFNENLPSILKDISLLSQNDDFSNYRLFPEEAKINLFFNKDVDGKSKVRFSWLPEVTFAVAGVAFLISTVFSIIDYTNRGSVFQEWYFLVMIVFYLFMPVFTTWFCIIFIEWHRKVYKKIHKEIGGAEPHTGAVRKWITDLHNIQDDVMQLPKVTNLGEYSDRIQDIFTQLSNGVFNYALSVNMMVYLATSTYCTSRMFADPQYIYYIFPLSFSAGHIFILCARCSDLLKEYRNVLSKLKDIIHTLEKNNVKENPKNADHSGTNLINNLHKLRENLHDSPPEVEILGSFTVDYGMLSTVTGFILSYALLINELFDDNTPVIYFVDPSIITTTSAAPIITGSALPITTSTIDPSNPSALSGGEIAGIVIGSVAGVALIGGVAICYIKKKLCFSK